MKNRPLSERDFRKALSKALGFDTVCSQEFILKAVEDELVIKRILLESLQKKREETEV